MCNREAYLQSDVKEKPQNVWKKSIVRGKEKGRLGPWRE